MLWSPVVKDNQGNAQYSQIGHLEEIKVNIKEKYGVELESVVNEAFLFCPQEMRGHVAKETAELQCPLMRLMQMESYLGEHVTKTSAVKLDRPNLGR